MMGDPRSTPSMASTDSTPSRHTILLLWLTVLTAYRMWVIPRLGISLYVDEAQYWTWAQHLDWGYFSKPPMIAWLIALATGLFGDGLIAVKLPALLLYPATAWLIYLLGIRLFDARSGFRAAIAFSLMPLVSAIGLFVSTDAPLLFFWTAALLFLLRALEKDRWLDWILLGTMVGLGCLSKYTMAAFGLSAGLLVLMDPARRQALANARLWIAVIIAALIFVPNVLWNWAHHFPTLVHTADITHLEGGGQMAGNPGEFLVAQAVSLGPAFALAYLVGLVWSFKHLGQLRHQVVLCFSLPLFLLVLIQAARSEANGNWAAPAMVTALLLATACLSRVKARWWLLALSVNVIPMLAVYHQGDIARLFGVKQTARLDPLKRARGWGELAAQVRPILTSHPNAMLLADHRTIMAHLQYELRDLDLHPVAWAPSARPQDHYQLTIPLADEQSSRPFLLVTQADPKEVSQHFLQSTELKHLVVDVMPGLRREATVMLLSGFKGYH